MWSLFSKKKKKVPNPLHRKGDAFVIYSECNRCGERFQTRIRRSSEVFQTFGQERGEYLIDKELIGSQCQNKLHIKIHLSDAYRPLDAHIEGGKFITEDEYQHKREEQHT